SHSFWVDGLLGSHAVRRLFGGELERMGQQEAALILRGNSTGAVKVAGCHVKEAGVLNPVKHFAADRQIKRVTVTSGREGKAINRHLNGVGAGRDATQVGARDLTV